MSQILDDYNIYWTVVGGAEKGGIVVRTEEDTSSLSTGRLATGSVVREKRLNGDRLQFQKVSGVGPEDGWLSLKLASGKELVKTLDTLWQVIGGAERGGIIVREECQVASRECSERLATGSIVQEEVTQGERLCYRLVDGSGQPRGWVSLTLQGRPLLRRLGTTNVQRLMKSVHDLGDAAIETSTKLLERFTLAEQHECVGQLGSLLAKVDFRLKRKALRLLAAMTAPGRLRLFALGLKDADMTVQCEAALGLSGGPAEAIGLLLEALQSDAWQVRACAARALQCQRTQLDLDSDEKLRAAMAAEVDPDVKRLLGAILSEPVSELPQLPAACLSDGQKLRVVAVHGARSNSSIMKFQVRLLKKVLGEADWFFADSPMIFHPVPGATDPIFGEPGEIEQSLSKGQPFRWWYSHGNGCYNDVEEGVNNWLSVLEEHSPIDVLVSFSQGSNCLSLALDALRRSHKAPCWRVSLMCSGGQIDDPIFQWPEGWTCSHPTLRMFNAGDDAFFHGSEGSLKHMYSDLVEIEHGDGHMFPHTEPHASEIYERIAQEIRLRCKRGRQTWAFL